MPQPDPAVVEWLMDVGRPVVRWLAATQLATQLGVDIGADPAQLERDLLDSDVVRAWLDRLSLPTDYSGWHSSRIDAFENVAHKLAELGLRAGMASLDERTAPIRDWLAAPPDDVPYGGFRHVLAAAALARLGYEDEAVADTLQLQLNAMHTLAASGLHDIYVDLADYPDIPKGRQGIPLVDPALTAGPYSQLPSIHAIYGLAYWPTAMDTQNNRTMRDAVLRYVLHDDYQDLREGYGLLRDGPRKYYSIGWSVHLPGWPGAEPQSFWENMTVQSLELMARFAVARKTSWFAEMLAQLDGYRRDDGAYDLPGDMLRETKAGYYVMGAYMGLDAGRRTAAHRRPEGTLRMLRLLAALL